MGQRRNDENGGLAEMRENAKEDDSETAHLEYMKDCTKGERGTRHKGEHAPNEA